MKKQTAKLMFMLVLLFLFFAAVPAYGASKKDVEAAKGKITSLEEEKKKTEALISQLESQKKDTEQYVRSLDQQLDSLEQELLRLEQQLADKEAEIEETGEQLKQAIETEKEQYASMKLRIRYMYEKGESSFLDLLLQSESMAELLNRAEYIQKISEYDRRMLDAYAAVKEEVAEEKQKLETEKQELELIQTQTEAKQASVELLVKEKTQKLQDLSVQIGAKTAEAEAYEKDIKAQEAQIKKIEAEILRQEEEARKKALAEGQKYNTVSLGNIKFKWPCPASSRITSYFGDRESPVAGASTNHKGIDIGASTGTNIVAAADGTVTIATYSYSAGNYIMLNHGGGVSTVYMHCSSLLVSVGASVKKGDVIARVGSTGYSTGPHLHFGIRYNGSYVNPLTYVSP